MRHLGYLGTNRLPVWSSRWCDTDLRRTCPVDGFHDWVHSILFCVCCLRFCAYLVHTCCEVEFVDSCSVCILKPFDGIALWGGYSWSFSSPQAKHSTKSDVTGDKSVVAIYHSSNARPRIDQRRFLWLTANDEVDHILYDNFTSGYWVRAFVLTRGFMSCGIWECCVTHKQVVRFQELCESCPACESLFCHFWTETGTLWQDHNLPCISSILSTGVTVSSRMVIVAGMTTKSPSAGGSRSPHENLDDHTSTYSKSADVCERPNIPLRYYLHKTVGFHDT